MPPSDHRRPAQPGRSSPHASRRRPSQRSSHRHLAATGAHRRGCHPRGGPAPLHTGHRQPRLGPGLASSTISVACSIKTHARSVSPVAAAIHAASVFASVGSPIADAHRRQETLGHGRLGPVPNKPCATMTWRRLNAELGLRLVEVLDSNLRQANRRVVASPREGHDSGVVVAHRGVVGEPEPRVVRARAAQGLRMHRPGFRRHTWRRLP